MLDFGFSEIVLTSAIALIVLGPEKLPKVARQVGNWMGRARSMARQLTEQLEREVNAEDLMKQTRRSATDNSAASAAMSDTHISSAPVPFETPYAPPAVIPPPNETLSQSGTAYSAQPSSPPHGADWHPAPPENKTSDG